MPSDISSTTVGALARGYRPGGTLVRKQLMFGIVAVVLIAVWGYARFGGYTLSLPQAPVVGTFTIPQTFVATPGLNLLHVHVRVGPGAQYRILETLDRGTPVTGIARTTDSTGAFWITLADGRGFVKESVLLPTNGMPAP